MVRSYVRTTSRGSTPSDVIRRAISCVTVDGRSVRQTALQFGMDRVTLSRHIKKAGSNDYHSLGRFRQIFTPEQELALEEYLRDAANIYFGLAPKDVRVLAYELVVAYNIQIPESWKENTQAGPDWFSNFMKRHPKLSIRTPEATSMSRASSFNKHNVASFFDKLAEVMDRENIQACNLWNIDETGISTVQKPRNIVAPKGVKQVGSLTSGERGAHVTMCAAVNATGNSMPPMFIFPRVNFHDHFVRDGPTGCVGASHPSGWMTAENFTKFMKHFSSYAKPTPENKVLLLMDNHDSHISIDTLRFAKANGIVMLSFPPHCSHKLQPLDRSVFGPLKKYINGVQDAWMRNHAGSSMTIYDIPGQAKEAWPLAATPLNIMSGFRVSGIYPFNVNIFEETEFSPCYVTDRPVTDKSGLAAWTPSDMPPSSNNDMSDHLPNPSSWEDINRYMHDMGKEVVNVSGDGHCLIHSVQMCVTCEGIGTVTHDELCEGIVSEVRNNIDYYDDFSNTSQDELIKGIDNYVRNNIYNTDAADIVLPALCNLLGVSAIVYRFSDGSVNINAVGPGRPNVVFNGDIHLALKGNGADAHYNALRQLQSVQESVARGTPEFTATPVFLPLNIRPHPKAPPRKLGGKGRARKRSAILTDTPEKNRIEAEILARTSKKQNKKVPLKKKVEPDASKRIKKVSKKSDEFSSSDEDELYCIVCVEPYSNSLPGEGWVRCSGCKEWSHEACTALPNKHAHNICHNCDDRDDIM